MKLDGRDDRLLEISLEEVLGGVRPPPELAPRILRALETCRAAAPPVPGAAAPTVESRAAISGRLAERGSSRTRRGVPRSYRLAGMLALILLVGLFAASLWHNWRGGRDRPHSDPVTPPVLAQRDPLTPGTPAAPRSPLPRPVSPESSVAEGRASPAPLSAPFDLDRRSSAPADAAPAATTAAAQPLPDEQVVAAVNERLRSVWQAAGVSPSEPATDAEWCRRTYLRLVGRIPRVEELSEFVAAAEEGSASAEDRREALVDRLLKTDEYAQYWGSFWTNVLIGRRGGLSESDLAYRDGLLEYLEESFRQNKSYDQVVYELLTASGANRPGTADYNGAVNFLLAGWDPRGMLATARTSRVFLGRQLQCVQCHDHPTNEGWVQHQYWEFNAFFRQMRAEREADSPIVRLTNGDYVGDSGDAREAESFYEQRNGLMKAAYPRFLDGTPGPASGRVAEADRRGALARLVIQAPELSRAAVNRAWAHFFGYGFTSSVDDIGPHTPATQAEVWDQLAQQFAAHDYDWRRLTRWIVLSDAFALSSKTPAALAQAARTEGPAGSSLKDLPEAGEPPLFSRYYSRPLPPEEVYESLQLLARYRSRNADPQAKLAWLGQFSRAMATDDGAEVHSFHGDIRQTLDMMTGPLMQRVTNLGSDNTLQQVVEARMKFRDKVEHLFLAALARKPSSREWNLVSQMVEDPARETQVLQDLWWALLNSNEFILDH